MGHKKRKTIKYILIVVAVLALVVGCTLRIAYINVLYPNAEVQQYRLNEPFTWRGFEVTIKRYQILTVPEIKEYIQGFDVTYVDAQGNDKDERILLVEVALKNISEEESYFSAGSCNLHSGAYAQSLSMTYYKNFNSIQSDVYVLGVAPGESTTVHLPFHIFSTQFSDNAWEGIDTRTFELVFSLYPINRVVTLK